MAKETIVSEKEIQTIGVSLSPDDMQRIEKLAKLTSTYGKKVTPTAMMRRIIERVAEGEIHVAPQSQERVRPSIRVAEETANKINAIKAEKGMSATEILISGLEAWENELGASVPKENMAEMIELCRHLQTEAAQATEKMLRIANAISSSTEQEDGHAKNQTNPL